MIEKINLKHLLVIAGIGLAINFMFLGCGKSKPNAVHNNATGTVRVGTGLEQARGNQQLVEERIGNATGRIDGITNRIGKSQGRIGNAQTRTGNIEGLVSEAEDIARKDRTILQTVKERAKTGDSSQGK